MRPLGCSGWVGALLLLASGCAWEPGEGFAVVEPTVYAAWVPLAARAVSGESPSEASGGYQRLSTDYQVRLEAGALSLGPIELLSSASPGASGFDPARPPPGYSLCHNGHCHRDDGALIPYEEIAAQLGGGSAARTVATLAVEPMDLLAAREQAVPCEPGCELPRTTLARGRWPVQALRLEGTVRDGRSPPRIEGEHRFRLELSSEGERPVAMLEGGMEVPSDRGYAPRVRLALRLEVTAALFDGVDWGAALAGSQGVVELSSNPAARTALLTRLAQLEPVAEVSREER